MILQDLFDYSYPVIYQPKATKGNTSSRLVQDMTAIMSEIDDHYPNTGTGVRFTSAFRWSPADARASLGTLTYYGKNVPDILLDLYVDKYCRDQHQTPMRNTSEKLYNDYKSQIREKLIADIPHNTDDFLVVCMKEHDCFVLLKLKRGTNANFDYVFGNMLKAQGISVRKRPMKISPEHLFTDIKAVETSGEDSNGTPIYEKPEGFWLKEISLKPHQVFNSATKLSPLLDGLLHDDAQLLLRADLLKEFVVGYADLFEFTFDKKFILASYEIVGSEFRSQWFDCDSEAFAGEGIFRTLEVLIKCLDTMGGS